LQTAKPSLYKRTGNREDTNQLFPVFLKLEELRVLIIGGGNVALEKLQAVLVIHLLPNPFGSDVDHDRYAKWLKHANLTIEQRPYDMRTIFTMQIY
jgi:siroheme synthase (precorrin-2 oxidase/ferrochelatase)